MPRVYVRRFDWDAARSLYVQGVPIKGIAALMGVSDTAIRRVVIPGQREIVNRRASAWASAWASAPVPCVEGCGRSCSRIGAKYGGGRCTECAIVHRSTTARPGELQCAVCREWKDDEAFPFNRHDKIGRRGRHGTCRPCLTIARREYREKRKVPCAGGCGRRVLAPNEQAAAARSKSKRLGVLVRTTGKCRSCANREVQARIRAERASA